LYTNPTDIDLDVSVPNLSEEDLKSIADLTQDQREELAHQLAVEIAGDNQARSLDARLLPASFSSLVPVLKTVLKSFLPFKRDGVADLSDDDLKTISSLTDAQMDELAQELAKSLAEDGKAAKRDLEARLLPASFSSLVPILKNVVKSLLPFKRSEYVMGSHPLFYHQLILVSQHPGFIRRRSQSHCRPHSRSAG
jgi:hypothetical protein